MTVSRVTRVSNPRRRRTSSKRRNPKRLTLKQKLHFGTPRQRAAVKAALSRKRNPKRRRTVAVRKRRRSTARTRTSNPRRRVYRRSTKAINTRRRRRRANPAHLLTIGPLVNPAPRRKRRKKNVARTAKSHRRRRRASANPRRRRRNSVKVIVRRRRRRAVASNPRRRRRRASANPRRRRRMNVRHHRRGRRRNPNVFGHSVSPLEMAKVVAAGLAGVAITKAVPNMLPAGIIPASPFTGSLVSLAVAIGSGMVVNMIVKGDPMLGYAVAFGGLMQAGSVMLNAFLPQVGSYIGLQGLGDLVPGRFPVPMNPITAGQQMMLPPPAAAVAAPGGHGAGVSGLNAIYNPFGRAF